LLIEEAAEFVAWLDIYMMQRVYEDEENLFSHHLIPH
jgi:hypothetical protein